MKLHTYINEILDIAKAEHMSMDVAVNMFLANVKNAGDSSLPHYKGADNVDYAALKPHVKELEESWPAFRRPLRSTRRRSLPCARRAYASHLRRSKPWRTSSSGC